MTEYGVLLADGSVAPCTNRSEAVVYSLGTDRELCVRTSGEWLVITPHPSEMKPECLNPGWRSVRRHKAAGEYRCAPCREFYRDSKRREYARRMARRREAAA